MTEYEKLKDELLQISVVLEKFPEDLKPKVFDLLVSTFTGKQVPTDDNSGNGKTKQGEEPEVGDEDSDNNAVSKTKSKQSTKKDVGPKKPAAESYSIDRNLNLRGEKDVPSFKDFFQEKQPLSTAEINAVSVYYLKQLKGMDTVTLNHVYTCYKEVGKKPADYFKQSFRDTKNKQGYIEFDDNWNLTIPHRGVSFVEHDLPHEKKKTK